MRLFPIVLAALLCACAGPERPGVESATSNLPEYGPEDGMLFDDTLSNRIFDREAPQDTNVEKLEARLRRADAVVLARISTVTQQTDRDGVVFQLVVQPLHTIMGETESEPIPLTVLPHSPSFALLRATGSQLMGTQVIFILKRYNEAGRPTMHWRAEANTLEMKRDIERIQVLEEVSR